MEIRIDDEFERLIPPRRRAVLLRNYLPLSPNVHLIDDPCAKAKGFAIAADAPAV